MHHNYGYLRCYPVSCSKHLDSLHLVDALLNLFITVLVCTSLSLRPLEMESNGNDLPDSSWVFLNFPTACYLSICLLPVNCICGELEKILCLHELKLKFQSISRKGDIHHLNSSFWWCSIQPTPNVRKRNIFSMTGRLACSPNYGLSGHSKWWSGAADGGSFMFKQGLCSV